jgi:surface protein
MFYGASSFNQDIGNWNVSNVTNMSVMFYGASSFNQPIGTWNTTNVTNMYHMFYGASSFNKTISYDSTNQYWNTSNVTNMDQMFYGATNFNNGGASEDTTHPMNWIVSQFNTVPVFFSVDSNLTFSGSSYNSPFSGNGYVPDTHYQIEITISGTTVFTGMYTVNGLNFVTAFYNNTNPTNNILVLDSAYGADYSNVLDGGYINISSIPNIDSQYGAVEWQLALNELYYKNSVGVWSNDTIQDVACTITLIVPPPPPICFLEGSSILCLINNEEMYVPIERIKRGTLVNTRLQGYKPVELIGYSKMYNPGHSIHSKNRLYKCTKQNYPELIEDLVVTGCHSILVGDLTEEQREKSIQYTGDVYITENRYRLIACLDPKAELYTEEGIHTIWHLALENEDDYMNYGCYANGLLVETTSKRMMKELSGMELV